jgi:hypothetical protein
LDGSNTDPDYCTGIEDAEEQQATENRQLTLKCMQKVVDYARPGISFTSIHHNFSRVGHSMQLKRFREYFASNGNQRQKLNRVETFVLDRFRCARDNYLPVHDLDFSMK